MANTAKRGPCLTVIAILYGVLALSNVTKALQNARDPSHLGIVILGFRFETFAANVVLGPLLGAFMAAYAYGVWTLRRWAVPLSIVYAFYVPLNSTLFWYMRTGPETSRFFSVLVYSAVGLAGSVGTAIYIAYNRDKFG